MCQSAHPHLQRGEELGSLLLVRKKVTVKYRKICCSTSEILYIAVIVC